MRTHMYREIEDPRTKEVRATAHVHTHTHTHILILCEHVHLCILYQKLVFEGTYICCMSQVGLNLLGTCNRFGSS